MSDQKSFLINRPSLGRAGGEITLQLSNLKLAYQLCWPASILDQTSRQSWLFCSNNELGAFRKLNSGKIRFFLSHVIRSSGKIFSSENEQKPRERTEYKSSAADSEYCQNSINCGRTKNWDAAIFELRSETWYDKYQISIMNCKMFRYNKSLSDESVQSAVPWWRRSPLLGRQASSMFSWLHIQGSNPSSSRCTERDVKYPSAL